MASATDQVSTQTLLGAFKRGVENWKVDFVRRGHTIATDVAETTETTTHKTKHDNRLNTYLQGADQSDNLNQTIYDFKLEIEPYYGGGKPLIKASVTTNKGRTATFTFLNNGTEPAELIEKTGDGSLFQHLETACAKLGAKNRIKQEERKKIRQQRQQVAGPRRHHPYF